MHKLWSQSADLTNPRCVPHFSHILHNKLFASPPLTRFRAEFQQVFISPHLRPTHLDIHMSDPFQSQLGHDCRDIRSQHSSTRLYNGTALPGGGLTHNIFDTSPAVSPTTQSAKTSAKPTPTAAKSTTSSQPQKTTTQPPTPSLSSSAPKQETQRFQPSIVANANANKSAAPKPLPASNQSTLPKPATQPQPQPVTSTRVTQPPGGASSFNLFG